MSISISGASKIPGGAYGTAQSETKSKVPTAGIDETGHRSVLKTGGIRALARR
jgi:hypothetical protein